MHESRNTVKKYTAIFLMVLSIICLFGFLVSFYSFKVGFMNSFLHCFDGLVIAFSGNAFNGKFNILTSLGIYAALLGAIVVIVLLCIKKNADKKLKLRGIIYAAVIAVFSIICLGAFAHGYDKLRPIFYNAFVHYSYGDANRAVKVFLILLGTLGVAFYVLGLASSIVCLTGVKEEEPVKEEEAPVEEPKEEPVEEVKEEEPVKEEPKEEPKEEEKPVEEPKAEPAPVVVAPVEPVAAKKKYGKRVPFATKLRKSDATVKSLYKELKAEMESYGVKSRLSISGDTYRLHTVKYLKITVAGKKLKVYYKLDPKNYIASTIPVIDASDKKVFAETPLALKVKSDLSLKRAKELIADMMAEAKIEKKESKEDKNN